jgi:hypothetical protein
MEADVSGLRRRMETLQFAKPALANKECSLWKMPSNVRSGIFPVWKLRR